MEKPEEFATQWSPPDHCTPGHRDRLTAAIRARDNAVALAVLDESKDDDLRTLYRVIPGVQRWVDGLRRRIEANEWETGRAKR